jgi:hypothetical protein
MSKADNKNSDYKTLAPPAKKGKTSSHPSSSLDKTSLESLENSRIDAHEKDSSPQTLINPYLKNKKRFPPEPFSETLETEKTARAEIFLPRDDEAEKTENLSFTEEQKSRKEQKRAERDRRLLSTDHWLARNGHAFSYIGLYLFSLLVFFRPYELSSALSFLSATAFYFALATLLVYLPTQLAAEGNLTVFPTEVKAVLVMTLLALLTIPIAKHPPTAWENFNDTFIKAVLMFIVMVNVLRTRNRLMGLIWLSLSMAFILSWQALDLFMKLFRDDGGFRRREFRDLLARRFSRSGRGLLGFGLEAGPQKPSQRQSGFHIGRAFSDPVRAR